MSIGYLISIIANVIFVILIFFAYFFRDAFNKWLFHKVESGEDKKKEQRETLKQLRNLLYEYSTAFNQFAMFSIGYFKGNAEGVRLTEPYFKDSKDKYEIINKKLLELTPDLDKVTRDNLNSLMAEVVKITVVATGGEKYFSGFKSMSLNELIQAQVNTTQQCTALIKDIEDKINK